MSSLSTSRQPSTAMGLGAIGDLKHLWYLLSKTETYNFKEAFYTKHLSEALWKLSSYFTYSCQQPQMDIMVIQQYMPYYKNIIKPNKRLLKQ